MGNYNWEQEADYERPVINDYRNQIAFPVLTVQSDQLNVTDPSKMFSY